MYTDKPSIDELYSIKILELDNLLDDEALHIGIPHSNGVPHSGRYPWGSGEHGAQRYSGFIDEYNKYKAQGLSDSDIAKKMGMSRNALQAKHSIIVNEERANKIAYVQKLRDKGVSTTEIGRRMGVNESTVRSWEKQALTQRATMTQSVANVLRTNCDDKGFIDVGAGVERELGITQTRLNTALELLKDEGYSVVTVDVPQATQPGQNTTIKVLAPEGTKWADIRYNLDKIQSINEYSPDDGNTFKPLARPTSVDSNRIKVRYAEEGGSDKDGVIELRRGVEDISLGDSSYAQVRIAVDGTHYLKGMAMYSDDMPDGVDIIFNTNKTVGTPMCGPKDNTVLKPLKNDPDNPFGASIKAGGQRYYIGKDGKEHLSPINKLKEEGDWDNYSKNLSSQFLSKQPQYLINKQLELAYAHKEEEYKSIISLTNPTVKKKLLLSFADDCDSAAVDLKAAALPRQASKVILPITSLKDNEVYAPTYKEGEHVVLVRYPHGGTFEIPELTVTHKNSAKKILGNAKDAIGINSKVAERLSGADFDGDTVVVIPVNDKVRVRTSPPLSGLVGFDPKLQYRGYAGMKTMDSRTKGIEMGKVSNLITDMTLRGAKPEELERAVKHSMVVIDAEKHGLDWKRSERENAIGALKEKYQGRKDAGASTLISKASSEQRVPERKKFTYDIDKNTGEKLYSETGRTEKKAVIDPVTGKKSYVDTGKLATQKSTKMAEVKDARQLSSGTKQEEAYASYANKLKALANESRKEYLATPNLESSPSAKNAYQNEVKSLTAKLNNALKNAPKERQAQLRTHTEITKYKKEHPDADKDDIKKKSDQTLSKNRALVGANKKDVQVVITDPEWAAIQAGAVSHTTLSKILNNTDLDVVKKLATPKQTAQISATKQAKIRNLASNGYTIAEIANYMNLSTTTVSKYIQ